MQESQFGIFKNLLKASCKTQPLLKIKLCKFSNYIKNKENKDSELSPCAVCSLTLVLLGSGSAYVQWCVLVLFAQRGGGVHLHPKIDATKGTFFQSPGECVSAVTALEEGRAVTS